ncbi:MAG: hypothetical protein IJ826_03270 [Bacteroidaceae bacterium]|nr:hypothetical protein [Bacteroidaceae bacterium]
MRKFNMKFSMSVVVILTILISISSCMSCGRNVNDPMEVLKHRIDKAEMVQYVDAICNAKLLYPDFFNIDTIGNDVAGFSYSDKNVKVLSLSYYRYPPRVFGSTDEAIRLLSDSLNVCLKRRKSSFIIAGEFENNSQIIYLSKYYHTIHGWSCYSLTYEKQYEDAVKRLINEIKDWKIYTGNTPECVVDICDFLNI